MTAGLEKFRQLTASQILEAYSWCFHLDPTTKTFDVDAFAQQLDLTYQQAAYLEQGITAGETLAYLRDTLEKSYEQVSAGISRG